MPEISSPPPDTSHLPWAPSRLDGMRVPTFIPRPTRLHSVGPTWYCTSCPLRHSCSCYFVCLHLLLLKASFTLFLRQLKNIKGNTAWCHNPRKKNIQLPSPACTTADKGPRPGHEVVCIGRALTSCDSGCPFPVQAYTDGIPVKYICITIHACLKHTKRTSYV